MFLPSLDYRILVLEGSALAAASSRFRKKGDHSLATSRLGHQIVLVIDTDWTERVESRDIEKCAIVFLWGPKLRPAID